MKKNKSIYVCQSCGAESLRWEGQCRVCNEWNTLIETADIELAKNNDIVKAKLADIKVNNIQRIQTGIDEFDRTLGGGLVKGQVLLLSGHPGIGKSTLILQLANNFVGKVLYISGEESAEQIAIRANRLKINSKNINIISTSDIDSAISNIKEEKLIILDSIQAVKTDLVKASIGSVSQIKESANLLVNIAKTKNICVVIIGHITKEGNIAGPKLLEHIVDTVLFLEGDSNHFFRLLKVNKNRFGDASEVGIFEMLETGLYGVVDPTNRLGEYNNSSKIGSCISVILEGNRPLALEVQALTVKTSFGYPKRAVSGYSLNRLALLCAVIQKYSRINLLDQDVYINLASGLTVKEPALDLAVVAAIISSTKDKPYIKSIAFFGEVGLSGEIRRVKAQEKRIKEAKSLGFNEIISSDKIKNINELVQFLN